MWAVTIVVIVGSIVGVGWWLQGEQAKPAAATQPAASGPPTVTIGHDYYFFIRLVEFTPLNPKGKKWDTDGSAPDADIRLTWRGSRTFSLPKRKNQLISTWDLFRVDVSSLITTGSTDIASMINGPIMRIMPNETITVEVVDDDPMMSDLALKLEIPLAQLHEGRNDLDIPPKSALTRLRIDLIATATPMAALVQ